MKHRFEEVNKTIQDHRVVKERSHVLQSSMYLLFLHCHEQGSWLPLFLTTFQGCVYSLGEKKSCHPLSREAGMLMAVKLKELAQENAHTLSKEDLCLFSRSCMPSVTSVRAWHANSPVSLQVREHLRLFAVLGTCCVIIP